MERTSSIFGTCTAATTNNNIECAYGARQLAQASIYRRHASKHTQEGNGQVTQTSIHHDFDLLVCFIDFHRRVVIARARPCKYMQSDGGKAHVYACTAQHGREKTPCDHTESVLPVWDESREGMHGYTPRGSLHDAVGKLEKLPSPAAAHIFPVPLALREAQDSLH